MHCDVTERPCAIISSGGYELESHILFLLREVVGDWLAIAVDVALVRAFELLLAAAMQSRFSKQMQALRWQRRARPTASARRKWVTYSS